MRGDRPGGPIRWRIHLAVPPERVYRALDSDEGRARFWAESAPERDGVIAFHFVNGYTWEGRILERGPPRRFAVDYLGEPVG